MPDAVLTYPRCLLRQRRGYTLGLLCNNVLQIIETLQFVLIKYPQIEAF